jgi:cytochrome P450
VGLKPALAFKNWKSTYGDIIGMKIGPLNAIVLNNLDLIKEAFNMTVFSGTMIPELKPLEPLITRGPDTGIISTDGKVWNEQRRFLVRKLKGLGFGKTSMESIALEDARDLVEALEKQVGHPMDPSKMFTGAFLNSLWHIVAGERLHLSDPKFLAIDAKLDASFEVVSAGVAFLFPWLPKLIPELSTGLSTFQKLTDDAFSLMEGIIEEHKNTYQEDNLRDFMDVYLREIYSTIDPTSSFYKEIGHANLVVGSMTMFLAGVEAGSQLLNWALYFLTKDLDAQARVQEEIDSVIGALRPPSLLDRPKMPFTEALMLEVFRMASFTPLGVPHRTMENVNFHGYKIPKGTIVIANYYGHHYDEKIWGDPENFRPTRFLEENGQELRKDCPTVVPITVGKRSCPGEALARNNFFLFMTSIIQRFSVTRDPSSERGKESFGLVRFHPSSKYIFEHR